MEKGCGRWHTRRASADHSIFPVRRWRAAGLFRLTPPRGGEPSPSSPWLVARALRLPFRHCFVAPLHLPFSAPVRSHHPRADIIHVSVPEGSRPISFNISAASPIRVRLRCRILFISFSRRFDYVEPRASSRLNFAHFDFIASRSYPSWRGSDPNTPLVGPPEASPPRHTWLRRS